MNAYFMQGLRNTLTKHAEELPEGICEQLRKLGMIGDDEAEGAMAEDGMGEGGMPMDTSPGAPDGDEGDAQQILQLIEQLPEEARVMLLQQLMAQLQSAAPPEAPSPDGLDYLNEDEGEEGAGEEEPKEPAEEKEKAAHLYT